MLKSLEFERPDCVKRLRMQFLDNGGDSDVYAYKGLVYKIYNHLFTLDMLENYKDMMNRTVVELEAHPYEAEVPVDGRIFKARYTANPVLDVYMCSGKELPLDRIYTCYGPEPISISPLIRGVNVDRISHMGYYSDKERRDLLTSVGFYDPTTKHNAIRRLVDPREWIKALSQEAPPEQIMGSQEDAFPALANHLEGKLGIVGIDLCDRNIMPIIDTPNQIVNFVITDLFQNIFRGSQGMRPVPDELAVENW
jgi:hypothetical protein